MFKQMLRGGSELNVARGLLLHVPEVGARSARSFALSLMIFSRFTVGASILFQVGIAARCLAWDYDGHRIVNQLALATLPADFPGFARTAEAQERIAFLAGEPDRWRNSHDVEFRHAHTPDHYLDVEDLARFGLKPETVSPFRYEFVAQLAVARARQPENFPALEPAHDADHTRALVGFLPWTINEQQAKLKSAFSTLKTLEDGGTPAEMANARQNAIYVMGVMGHFVGDATQPLHTTKHFNGWVGANPRRYTTNHTIHAWIDGGFMRRMEINETELRPRLRPARLLQNEAAGRTNMFPAVMNFLLEQHRLVEPLYRLNKQGKLTATNPGAAEGREFIAGQLVKAGQMLGDLWLTAWRTAPPDTYLQSELARRKPAPDPPP